jgi:hypothetical protein
MKRLCLVLGMMVLAVLGCGTQSTTTVITVEIPVEQTVLSPVTLTPGEPLPITVVAPTEALTHVPAGTPTPEEIRVRVGNKDYRPTVDKQVCYASELHWQTSKQTAVNVGTEVKVLGRADPIRGQEWLAVELPNGEVCWFDVGQVEFLTQIDWEDLPIYP